MRINNKIIDIINSNVKEVSISEDQSDKEFISLGINSSEFKCIISEIEETYSIKIPDDKRMINQIGTINKIVDIVHGKGR